MASTKRAWAVGGVMVAAILAAHEAAARQEPGPAHADEAVARRRRVRTNDPALAALIREATDRSPTFRHLAERIQVSDSLVYIVRGRCGHRSVRAWRCGSGSPRPTACCA